MKASEHEMERRMAELPYREVRRKNLDRVADTVRLCMAAAGDTPLPDNWDRMVKQIAKAYGENRELLMVVLWRMICNFSMREEWKLRDLPTTGSRPS